MADVTIDRLEIEIAASSTDATEKIDKLRDALDKLASVASSGAGLKSVAKQLDALTGKSTALNDVSTAFDRMRTMIDNINKPLAELTARLGGLNDTSKKLENVGKYAKKVGNAAGKASSGTNSFGMALKDLRLSAVAAYHGLKKALSTFQSIVSSASDYTEDMNLFSVSMGQYAASAKEYADEVNSALGIDTGDWMRAQGVFMQLASGFGVAGDQAEYMSRNLTQISYDLASFFNLDPEEAVNKVRSGLSGELEPLRNLGYALDRNTLQELARARGIDKSVDAMSQAEKAQLRYIAILTQNQNVMGDMSRTIEAPANAMRVLEQQVKQLGRAVGNVLIPWLQAVIPVVQAVVTVLTEFVNMLAQLVGFELPEISSTPVDDVATGATDAEEALSGAAGAATELKNALLGIDELNVISPNSGGGGGAGAATGTDAFFGELPGYDDFINNISDKTKALTDELRARMKPFFDFVESHFDEIKRAIKIIGASLAALKVAGLISSLGQALRKLDKLGKAVAAVAEVTLQFTLNKWTMDTYLDSGSWLALLSNAMTTALGSLLLYNTVGPKGIVIGAAVSVVANAVSIGLGIADGSVDVDDPKTWIASIMSVVIGTAGGAIGLLKSFESISGGEAFGIAFGVSAMFTIAAITYGGVASGSFTMGDAMLASIGTVIAGGIAGASVGSAVGGAAGAGVGLLIGLGVGVTLSIVSIVAGEKNKYKALYEQSDFHAMLEDLRESASEPMEVMKQIQVNISTRYTELENIETDYAAYMKLVDDVFKLAEMPEKTVGELKLMKNMVDIINDLSPDGSIIMHFDETTGAIAETREQVQLYLEDLEKQAKAEAAYNMLVDAYKDEIQAKQALLQISGKLADAKGVERNATINYRKALDDETEATKAWYENAKGAEQQLNDAAEAVRLAELAMWDANDATSKLSEEFDKATVYYNNAAGDVKFLQDTIADYTAEIPAAAEATDTVSDSVNSAFDETPMEWSSATDDAIGAVMQAFNNGEIDITEATNRIHQIVENAISDDLADDWYASGRYLMKGFADGIESEIQSVNRVVKDVASGVTKTLNQTLEINSPSRKWMESGYWLDAGLAMGIEQNAASVMDTVGDLAGNLETGIDPNGWYSNNWQPAANYRTGSYAVSIDWREFLEQLREVMVEAMSENSTDDEKSVYVYLDGKQISSVNEKWQRDRGAAIFGTGVRP